MPHVGPDSTDDDGLGCLAGCGLAVVVGGGLSVAVALIGLSLTIGSAPTTLPPAVRLLLAALEYLLRVPGFALSCLAPLVRDLAAGR
ncbi:MAG: hypothetical protein K2X82_05965 [Gemmataceae bacterium]|nr:hypothetical protein [Gemmataceae bacterium]